MKMQYENFVNTVRNFLEELAKKEEQIILLEASIANYKVKLEQVNSAIADQVQLGEQLKQQTFQEVAGIKKQAQDYLTQAQNIRTEAESLRMLAFKEKQYAENLKNQFLQEKLKNEKDSFTMARETIKKEGEVIAPI